jgi:chitin disaccharide deacetylase
MILRAWIGLTLAFLIFGPEGSESQAQTKSVAERLGYPANSKLLIIHADDLAVAHSIDRASFEALDKNAVTSASVMVPCAWVEEVAAYAKDHPETDLGLHLTLTSEWKNYRWGSVKSKDRVASLLEPSGYLWPETETAAKKIKPEEAEQEIRAQIERATAAGIRPTHLDSHMGVLFATPELFAVYVKVAREYGLPFLAVRVPSARKEMLAVLSDKDIVPDRVEMASPEVQIKDWNNFYVHVVDSLKPGLTELIVHLGYDDSELRAVTLEHPDYGSAWRQRDSDVMSSPEFKKALAENHVILVKWKDLKKLMQ